MSSGIGPWCALIASLAVLRQQDDGIVGVTEARSAFRDHLQNRLDIGWRSGDHPQDRAGRRLLLQRFRHLAVARLHLLEQPHVLEAITAWSANV